MGRYKVLILNQQTDYDQWVDVQKSQHTTWVRDTNEVKVISYRPDADMVRGEFREDGYYLYYGIDEKEEWANKVDPRNERFIKALRYCLDNYEFDFILRTGSPAYIVYDKLLKYLDLTAGERVYGGALNAGWALIDSEFNFKPVWDVMDKPAGKRIFFVSGWNCVLSKDCVEVLVNNELNYLKYKTYEDVATGLILNHDTKHSNFAEQLRVPTGHIIKDLDSLHDIVKLNMPYLYNVRFIPTTYHMMDEIHKFISNDTII